MGKDLFLEASAGTGKTFAIEHLVAKLLKDGMQLEEILVVTFTRAATRDLRNRIRQNLREKSLIMGNAEIYTIHGFCHRMLSEFAFEAGVSYEISDPDDESAIHAFMQKMRHLLHNSTSEISPSQLHLLLKSHRKNMPFLMRRLLSLVESKGHLPKTTPFSELAEKFKGHSCDFELFAPMLKGACNINGEIHEKWLRNVEQMHDLDAFIATGETILSLEPKRNAGEELKPFLRLKSELLPIVEEAMDTKRILITLAHAMQNQLLEWQKKNQQLTPDGLLFQMETSLENSDFIDKVSRRYRAVIIDEFQDTDPVQWKIFETLFRGKIEFFCVVGDPKQSIYSFRGADVSTYYAAKEAFENHAVLETNYRSDPALIHALNHYFLTEDNPLDYLSVKPGAEGEKYLEDGKGRLHFFSAEGSPAPNGKFPSNKMEEEAFFPYIAREIAKNKAFGIPYKEQVVLVKDRYQAERLEEFLDIPTVSNARNSLADTSAFRFLRALLAALLSPRDLSKVKALLGHPFMGATLSELHGTIEDYQEIITQLKERSIDAVVTNAFLAKLLGGGNIQEYSDLMQLLDLVSNMGIEEAANYLDDVQIEDPELHPEVRQLPTVDDDALQIMTTFMSKGLEFDVVYALGTASRQKIMQDLLKLPDSSEFIFNDPKERQFNTAVREIEDEKLRQLYVALTRAKKRVYVACAIDVKEKPIPAGSAAPVELFGKPISTEKIESNEFPEPPPLQTPELIAPEPLHVSLPITSTASFSSLAPPHISKRVIQPEGALPAGAAIGTLFHSIFEKVIEKGIYQNSRLLEQYIRYRTHTSQFAKWEDQITSLILRTFDLDISGFTLREVCPSRMIQEMEFLYEKAPGEQIKGFIDLVFEHNGKSYIFDWKSNLLSGYDKATMKEAMEDNHYFLQAQIYTEALKKHMHLTSPIEQIFAGVYYVFLREPAIYAVT
ncbi:MAG: UvrD-helicase domain-containing protein [Simkaniaceae bacterium]|nr:UvrD-helicase domain-containing protein [Simkaniaceae bacterium]